MGKSVSVCDICKRREAFYFRPYSGMRMCRKCFATSVEDKARATIAKYNMLSYDDKIAVAVSGGKDSVSLLHVLAKVERQHPKAELTAITVDEGIRGYRDEALKIAAENCRELSIEHRTVSFRKLFGRTFDQMMKRVCGGDVVKLTPCAYCGVLRRKALNVAARNIGADKLATGHTLDDETQTILLNIFHGDVLRIAKEKPVTDLVHPKLVRRIKPFCEVPERETALYAFVKGIRFQSTPCPYAGEALRNDARAILNGLDEKHPGIMFSILKSIERIRPALEEMAKLEELSECVECGEPTTGRMCRTCQMRKQIG
jgi:uncharacterized protein (TIGR00269 family)